MPPSPWHVGHGVTVTNWPKNDRCARRTSPAPLHVGHVCDLEPGSAPLPSHRSHCSRSFIENFLSTPVATSSSLSWTVILTSWPPRGPAPPPDRPPPKISSSPPKPPKSRMKMPSASDRSTWWKPPPPPRRPASPY